MPFAHSHTNFACIATVNPRHSASPGGGAYLMLLKNSFRHKTVLALAVAALAPITARAIDEVSGNLIRFNDNGAWSWFEDERAIVDGNQILIGSNANGSGIGGAGRAGNVEVTTFDLAS